MNEPTEKSALENWTDEHEVRTWQVPSGIVFKWAAMFLNRPDLSESYGETEWSACRNLASKHGIIFTP